MDLIGTISLAGKKVDLIRYYSRDSIGLKKSWAIGGDSGRPSGRSKD